MLATGGCAGGGTCEVAGVCVGAADGTVAPVVVCSTAPGWLVLGSGWIPARRVVGAGVAAGRDGVVAIVVAAEPQAVAPSMYTASNPTTSK